MPPLVDAGEDRTCHRHVEINFTASFLDDLSDTHTAWWDFDGDGTFDQEGIVEEEGGCGTVYGTHVYTLPGEYTAWVCVQDDKGESACDDIIITVLNTPPVAQCQDVLVPAGIDGYADPSVDGGSYDPDGDDITLEQDPPGPYPVGVHHVGLSVTDPFGAQDTCEAIIVVYDPSGGFVTGGGWIWSPEGAFIGNPSVTGKANFGFVSKYQKGAMIPTGQTEFVFQAGDLNFHSSSYEWLVVTGSNYARFKGTGTINGSGEYEFMLWAGDDNPDTFRIKIWTEDESGVEDVVYDNDMDQPISGGSIVVHTK